MRYQENINRKQRGVRLFWILILSLLALTLSGWLSPVGAQVWLCGEEISPGPHGIYRLRGHLTCSEYTILHVQEAGAEFDLRGFTAIGGPSNTGILIQADDVKIVGGNFKKCETALNVSGANNCEIENFKAFDSTDKAIRLRGDGNIIVKSLCQNAGNDCFELRGDGPIGNTAESCTAVRSVSTDESVRGFRFRGPGYAYKCSAIGCGAEGFQISSDVSNVTIEECLAINNAEGGIEIKGGATDNVIRHNIAFANGDGINFFDLIDENENCVNNTWEKNKFRSSNAPCIE